MVTPQYNRIVRGKKADPHEYPWNVILYNNNQPFCGGDHEQNINDLKKCSHEGALINNHQVLTAAHCTMDVTDLAVGLETNNLLGRIF